MTVALLDRNADDGLFAVDLDRFQGPLDLLLHLIRQQDIDIFDIPIARITDQFLKAVKEIAPDQIDNAGAFLETAATLIRIKAQMLLPRHGEGEDEDPRAELVRRLLEYEQIREVSDRLSRAEAERARLRGKGYVPPRPRPQAMDTPLETTWDEVFQAALEVRLPDPRDREHRITTRTISMEEKATYILETLSGAARVEFSKLLKPFLGKMHGVMTLLAGLELSRRREIFMRQIRPFSELWLYRRDGEDGSDMPEPEPGPESPEVEPDAPQTEPLAGESEEEV
jgi:segregation and condensation protein A